MTCPLVRVAYGNPSLLMCGVQYMFWSLVKFYFIYLFYQSVCPCICVIGFRIESSSWQNFSLMNKKCLADTKRPQIFFYYYFWLKAHFIGYYNDYCSLLPGDVCLENFFQPFSLRYCLSLFSEVCFLYAAEYVSSMLACVLLVNCVHQCWHILMTNFC